MWVSEWVSVCTWARMFCSLMSFCRSRLGLEMATDRTSWPLFAASQTKNTRSSKSFVTNLKHTRRRSVWNQDCRLDAWIEDKCSIFFQGILYFVVFFASSLPAYLRSFWAMLPYCSFRTVGLQHLAGIVGKVQVSDLGQRHWNDCERLLVLFCRAGADLRHHERVKTQKLDM